MQSPALNCEVSRWRRELIHLHITVFSFFFLLALEKYIQVFISVVIFTTGNAITRDGDSGVTPSPSGTSWSTGARPSRVSRMFQQWWGGNQPNLQLAVFLYRDATQFTRLKQMQKAFSPPDSESLCHGLFSIKLFIVESSLMESGILVFFFLPNLILQCNC